MGNGVHPTAMHNGEPFLADPARMALGGHSLGAKGIVLALRADWSELAHTFGLPTWSDATAPCPFCDCTSLTLHAWQGASLDGIPWQERSKEDYEHSCLACEIWVEPSEWEWRFLRSALVYDDDGRELSLPAPELGLEVGDRLEPCRECPDTGEGFDARRPERLGEWKICTTISNGISAAYQLRSRIGCTPALEN